MRSWRRVAVSAALAAGLGEAAVAASARVTVFEGFYHPG